MIKAQDISDSTVGHIVAQDYRKSAALFARGIDYSCGGDRKLHQIFPDNTGEVNMVLQEWEGLDHQPPSKELNFLRRDMPFLIDYIVQLHHCFITSQTRFITELAYKVADANHDRHPEIRAVADLFEQLGKRLETKGRLEESELFPYLVHLYNAETKGSRMQVPAFGALDVLLNKIRYEGQQVVAALAQIRRLTGGFTVPPYTTSTCRILYKMLADYQADTLLHLHLENNILFPKAIGTEARLRAGRLIA